ncbi:hypothetical protein LCGC14_0266930 [marine sediment metagenome]|uniref:Uncharacterized protein n=1 Tax=marine sediment metagenome TaxID=412755 RepID=A0A0F9UGM2_9ZZZZ
MTDLKPLDLGIKWYDWILSSIIFVLIVLFVSIILDRLFSRQPTFDHFRDVLLFTLVFRVFYQRQKEYEAYEKTAGVLTKVMNLLSKRFGK